MAITATPAFVQNPKLFSASIVNADAQTWKLMTSGFPGLGAGANGAKLVGLNAASTDSAAHDIQIGIARTSTVTITIASPGVVTWTGHNFSNGDQVFFTTTGNLPTGLTAGATYYVVSSAPATGTFQVAATFGGSAINTSATQAGTHTGYVVRVHTTASVAATAGTVSGVPSANLLGSTNWPGSQVDNDGQAYLLLEGGDFVVASSVVTVTSGKIINLLGYGGNF